MIKNIFNQNNIEYKENVSLKKYNTYRLNTTCDYLVFPKDEKELVLILKELSRLKIKHMILGNGSNIIFEKDHYDGVIIKLDKLNKIEYNDNIVTVEAGYSLIKLATETASKGLSGLTFATGIPGAVGASTAMNAGAYKSDMSDFVKSVRVLTPDYQIKELSNADLNFSYRHSFLKDNPDYIVLSTTFALSQEDPIIMKKQIAERRKKRLETQPLDMPSAGSVFRNPENMYAGELIEKAGFKGKKIGDAEVSTKHANFIINKGNATGKDIVKLIEAIKKEVKKTYDVDLILEQIIIK